MDKKALTRQYKETRRPMGVFQVRTSSAEGAEYDSQGQARSASPLVPILEFRLSPEEPVGKIPLD
jgi:hypothetical protein